MHAIQAFVSRDDEMLIFTGHKRETWMDKEGPKLEKFCWKLSRYGLSTLSGVTAVGAGYAVWKVLCLHA